MWFSLLVACFPVLEGDKSVDAAGGDSGVGTEHTGLPQEEETGESCDQDADGDGWCTDRDCDDDNAEVNPDAVEVCNEYDDDCDAKIDEGVAATYYVDNDGDGYGGGETVQACEPSDGLADNGADCDDADASVHPGATDDENGKDDDCDGELDEDAPDEPVVPEVTLSWSSSGVTVRISGGGSGWDFGMAESGVGERGWFGESCFPGDEPYGYDDYGYELCHTLGATGGSLKTVHSLGDLEDGTTLFTDVIAGYGNITFYLENQDDGACYSWGDDPYYYADLGCDEL